MILKNTTKTIHKTETYLIEGTDFKVLKKYVGKKLKSVEFTGSGPHKSYPMVVKPEFKEFIKTQNPFHNYKDAENLYVKLDDNTDFDKAVKDGLVYFFYGSGHVLFDIKGNPVPLPHMFDYIGTDFHSVAIDLDKAIKVLSNHKWVLNKEALTIIDVPSYNSDSSNHKYIGVNLLPDAKTYKIMYEMALATKRGTEFFSTILKDLVLGKCYEYPEWDPLKIHKFRKPRNY